MRVLHHDIGRDPLYKIWNSSSHYCMIIHFYSDGGSVVLQDRIYPIKKGGLCFINARTQHYTIPDNPEKYDRSKIHMTAQRVSDMLKLFPEDKKLHSLFEKSSVVYAEVPLEYMDDVESIYADAEKRVSGELDSAAFASCFLRLLLYLRDYYTEYVEYPNDDLTKVIDFINRSYSQNITLDDICRETYISKFYLCRKFKSALGVTIMEYLLETRIAAAINMLASGEYSISEISEECGFSSHSYFCQVFKKTVGVTPIAYRARLRQ